MLDKLNDNVLHMAVRAQCWSLYAIVPKGLDRFRIMTGKISGWLIYNLPEVRYEYLPEDDNYSDGIW